MTLRSTARLPQPCSLHHQLWNSHLDSSILGERARLNWPEPVHQSVAWQSSLVGEKNPAQCFDCEEESMAFGPRPPSADRKLQIEWYLKNSRDGKVPPHLLSESQETKTRRGKSPAPCSPFAQPQDERVPKEREPRKRDDGGFGSFRRRPRSRSAGDTQQKRPKQNVEDEGFESLPGRSKSRSPPRRPQQTQPTQRGRGSPQGWAGSQSPGYNPLPPARDAQRGHAERGRTQERTSVVTRGKGGSPGEYSHHGISGHQGKATAPVGLYTSPVYDRYQGDGTRTHDPPHNAGLSVAARQRYASDLPRETRRGSHYDNVDYTNEPKRRAEYTEAVHHMAEKCVVTLKQEVAADSTGLSRLRQEVSRLQQEVKDKNSELSSVRQEVESKDEALSRLRQELSSKELRLLSLERTLENTLAEKNIQVEDLTRELEELRRGAEAAGQLQQQVAAMKQELSKRESALQQQVDRSDSTKSRLQQDRDKADRERRRLQQDVAVKDAELSQLQQKLSPLQQEVSQLRKEVSLLQQELSKRDSALSALQQQVDRSDSTQSRLQQDRDKADRERWRLQQEVDDKDRQLSSLQQQVEKREEELSRLQQEIQTKGSEFTDLERKHAELYQRLSSMASERMRQDNACVEDLSDPVRHSAVVTKWQALMNGEYWTLFEVVQGHVRDERQIAGLLYSVFQKVFTFVQEGLDRFDQLPWEQLTTGGEQEEARLQSQTVFTKYLTTEEFRALLRACAAENPQFRFLPPSELRRVFSAGSKKFLKKKPLPSQLIQDLHEEMEQWDLRGVPVQACHKFADEVLRLCFLMALQSPPMALVFDRPEDKEMDALLYEPDGDRNRPRPWMVNYVILPPLLRHKDGPVLNKGIVELK